jgi:hypothetical protein
MTTAGSATAIRANGATSPAVHNAILALSDRLVSVSVVSATDDTLWSAKQNNPARAKLHY